MKPKRFLALVMALFGIMASTLSTANASTSAPDLKASDAASLIRAYTDRLNSTIADPRRAPSSRTDSYSNEALEDTVAAKQKALSSLYLKVAATGIRYGSYHTTISIDALRSSVGSASADATERTRLVFKDAAKGAPPYQEFTAKRHFEFTLTQNSWKIASVKVNYGGMPPTNEPLAPLSVPRSGSAIAIPPSHAASTEPLRESQQVDVKDLSRASYNYQAMADYARQYAYNYNPSYRNWAGAGSGGDCTNFVSQALRAGGWANANGYYLDYHYWWYNWFNQTRTWINAHYWYWFGVSSGRTYILSSIYYMGLADVLQADWQRDGVPDHTMLVTARDYYGNIYMTYHSTNTKDRPLVEIINANPSAWYYPHRT